MERGEVRNDHLGQDNDAATSYSLDGSANEEDCKVSSQTSYERAGEEEYNTPVYHLITT